VIDFNTVPSQSQRTPSLDLRELRDALRTCVARSANEHIRSLPDEAKAEIVEDVIEECIRQFILTKSPNSKSPNYTPRAGAPLSTEEQQHQFETQALPLEEQTRELPMENWGSCTGEGSHHGLGLAIQPSAFPPAPRGRSFTSPNLPNCYCPGQCECPQYSSSFFNEQYMESEASNLNQSPYRCDWGGESSSMRMF
jgi:hypothetical protein